MPTLSKLDTEVLEIQRKINGPITALMSDPQYYRNFQRQAKAYERGRKLYELKEKEKSLANFANLMKKDLPTDLVFNLDKFVESSSQFKATSTAPSLDLGRLDLDSLSEKFKRSITDAKKKDEKTFSQKIDEAITDLQKQFEDLLQEKFADFADKKLKKKNDELEKSLEELTEHPEKEAAKILTRQSQKVDQAEVSTISTIYKVCNFLKTGEYEVSFSQKLELFKSKSGEFISDKKAFETNPQNLTQLTKAIKKAMDENKEGEITGLIKKFYHNEQKRIQTVLSEMEKTLEVVEQTKDEEFVDRMLFGSEKELNKRLPFFHAEPKRTNPFTLLFNKLASSPKEDPKIQEQTKKQTQKKVLG